MSFFTDSLFLPRKKCPRCTPITAADSEVGTGQVWIFLTKKYEKCSKCKGRGWLYRWQDHADQAGEGPSFKL